MHVPVMVKVVTTPAYVMATDVADAAAVPVFDKVMLFVALPVAHVGDPPPAAPAKLAERRFWPVTATWAELDEEPKMPNTKPPIATAAIRVTAMISTVAMIGEMAFLPYFPFCVFIVERV